MTLIEVIVVVAILAVLVGLVLGAIQRVRAIAVRTQSVNNLRQIILATHQLSDSRSDKVNQLTKTTLPQKPFYTEQSIFWEMLPWTHGPWGPPPTTNDSNTIVAYMNPIVKIYISPGDPSLESGQFVDVIRMKTSYSCNFFAFDGTLLYPLAVSDGNSNTIAYAERYYHAGLTQIDTNYADIFPKNQFSGIKPHWRRATFADKGWLDVVPVTDPVTKVTHASVPGKTFQDRPKVEEADHTLLQSPHLGGLPVALFDGSVRVLSPSIAETVYWGLVTPNGGEVLGADF